MKNTMESTLKTAIKLLELCGLNNCKNENDVAKCTRTAESILQGSAIGYVLTRRIKIQNPEKIISHGR